MTIFIIVLGQGCVAIFPYFAHFVVLYTTSLVREPEQQGKYKCVLIVNSSTNSNTTFIAQ